MMDLRTLVALVVNMRRAQRAFFLLPHKDSVGKQRALVECRRLETEVDKAIAQFTAPGLEL